jgi:hypothetical protein
MGAAPIGSFRYGKPLAGAFVIIALSRWTDWNWMWLGAGDVTQEIILGLAFTGAITAWVTSTRPIRSPFTFETITVGTTFLLSLLFIHNTIWRFWERNQTLNLTALAFLVVVGLSFSLAEDLVALPKVVLRRVDDTTLGVSIAGAAALLLSLFLFPWYSTSIRLPNGRRVQGSITFAEWRQLYDTFRRDLFDFQLVYFELGYWISAGGAAFLLFVLYRSRTKPLPVNPPIRWLLLSAVALVALWQLVIVIAMNSIDDPDGGVSFGAWLGVVGHVAILYGGFQATRRPPQSDQTITTGVAPIIGAMPPPPSGDPVP